ncbi:ATP-dependent nuclease [Staphylococcus coagulans]|uniref:ATP-dependent nuclease n=1 Tax=Staphylococcus coagulans TaxID=74706 RepID=UPI0015FC4E93|nr:AAA family ATPase [Staphylococcus coagulans]MBA8764286.1 AAA family ATPase [Staphylococcus coagulans]MBT2810494.1 AAA family ATPase [Staphylococcus coagulans]MBT2811888.1 AAA family ATPase [Staphylococcus coagulans]MBT2819002.1 AAA family ATPase [Staphylococcus coagulans]MBT2821815.1 AAA family ATPase [Staphylococcus coagulans]
MAQINKITISNFRSFKSANNTLKDIKNLNMFTGKNNAGKTNILRAINLFFNPDDYDPKLDKNMIKKITGGGTAHPKIKVDIQDENIDINGKNTFTIEMNLNKDENVYKIGGNYTHNKLDSSKKIQQYLNKSFKCVYLSTTDESITEQAYSLVNDMILQYYQKKNRNIKKSINNFEKNYQSLLDTFRQNIESLEGDLKKQFDIFKKNEINISPKLIIGNEKGISDFLLENIRLELDDAYSQVLQVKGAGIQRTSLILLTFFLLKELYSNANKIILLDEPEAFLYPLLITELKDVIENATLAEDNNQIFMTSHSKEFLSEINNKKYSFYNIEQEQEINKYKRSANPQDINKYSVIKQFDSETKYTVLKNYGLLDNIDDHDKIIICEGKTDRNYLVNILEENKYRPQIRYGPYADYIKDDENIEEVDSHKNFFSRGTNSIIPILLYLDRISDVNREIFILLDGDRAGNDASKKIHSKDYKNLNLKIKVLPENKQIEDMVFEKNNYINKILSISEEIRLRENSFKEVLDKVSTNESMIDKTKQFIDTYSLNEDIGNIKHQLSINLKPNEMKKDWVLNELNSFFNL